MECVVRISVFNFTNTGTKIHLQFQQGPFRGRTPVSLLHVIHFLAAWFPGFLCAIPAEIMSNSVFSVISRFVEEYRSSTPNKLKMIDAYLLYILLTECSSSCTVCWWEPSLQQLLIWIHFVCGILHTGWYLHLFNHIWQEPKVILF